MITEKLTELIEKLNTSVASYEEKKSYKKVVAVRKVLQEIKTVAQDMRGQISNEFKKEEK